MRKRISIAKRYEFTSVKEAPDEAGEFISQSHETFIECLNVVWESQSNGLASWGIVTDLVDGSKYTVDVDEVGNVTCEVDMTPFFESGYMFTTDDDFYEEVPLTAEQVKWFGALGLLPGQNGFTLEKEEGGGD